MFYKSEQTCTTCLLADCMKYDVTHQKANSLAQQELKYNGWKIKSVQGGQKGKKKMWAPQMAANKQQTHFTSPERLLH